MAVNVRCNSWYVSLPPSAKKQRGMIKFWVCGKPKSERQFCYIFIYNLSLYTSRRFSFVIVLTFLNEANDFTVSQDS